MKESDIKEAIRLAEKGAVVFSQPPHFDKNPSGNSNICMFVTMEKEAGYDWDTIVNLLLPDYSNEYITDGLCRDLAQYEIRNESMLQDRSRYLKARAEKLREMLR